MRPPLAGVAAAAAARRLTAVLATALALAAALRPRAGRRTSRFLPGRRPSGSAAPIFDARDRARCSTARAERRTSRRAGAALVGTPRARPRRRCAGRSEGAAAGHRGCRASGPGGRRARARGRHTAPSSRALRAGAYEVTTTERRKGQAGRARAWLLIRDFRQATRFTRPGVDATTAIEQLESGDLSPADAAIQIRKDLLDAYQARLLGYLDEAATEAERGYLPGRCRIDRGGGRLLEAARPRVRGAARCCRKGRGRPAVCLAAGARGLASAPPGRPSPTPIPCSTTSPPRRSLPRSRRGAASS